MTLISLRVSSNKAYVWDVDDIATLRSQHHICGILTGTLPHLSQQNVFLGVPLLLMPEEVVLLVDKGLACIVHDRDAHHDPSTPELATWDSDRRRRVQAQLASTEAHDAREALHPDRGMSESAILKRKEREARRTPGTLNLGPSTESESALDPVDPSVPGPRQSNTPYTVHVPGQSDAFEWYCPDAHSFTTLAAAREAGVWDYPTSSPERARCGVFRDLWEQGYFMGSGIKFGGGYLVYPGDPLRYHSHFVASVIESPIAPLRPMEIVAHGRLGTGTKKAHLFCEWDEDTKTVTYYSIEWAGFG